MKVDIHAVNFSVDKKLIDFIQERMDKLEKFYDKVVFSDVFLKLDNTSEKENKVVEIKVQVPGDEFVVKKQCKSFEEGTDLAVDSLERVLIKRKEKVK
jgi:putative sigma-54 modulation protein